MHDTLNGQCKFFVHLEEVEFRPVSHLQMESVPVSDPVYIRPSSGQHFAPPNKELIGIVMIYSEAIFAKPADTLR